MKALRRVTTGERPENYTPPHNRTYSLTNPDREKSPSKEIPNCHPDPYQPRTMIRNTVTTKK